MWNSVLQGYRGLYTWNQPEEDCNIPSACCHLLIIFNSQRELKTILEFTSLPRVFYIFWKENHRNILADYTNVTEAVKGLSQRQKSVMLVLDPGSFITVTYAYMNASVSFASLPFLVCSLHQTSLPIVKFSRLDFMLHRIFLHWQGHVWNFLWWIWINTIWVP